ncbi:MAG: IS4 family transposase [bacterium]
MVSIRRVLAQIKDDWTAVLTEEQLTRVCRDAGATWRHRTLTPVVTIYIFLLQILHGNTAMTNLPRLSGQRFTPAAYCQARKRVPLAVLRRLLHETGVPLRADVRCDSRWRGHRTWLVDGSSCSMPDTPTLRKHFGQPSGQKAGCGFPVAHLLALFDSGRGHLLDVLVSSWRLHDLNRMAELHAGLQPGDVLVADRGFCSYAHLALLFQRNVFAVLRLHQAQIVDFRPRRPAAVAGCEKGRPRSTWLARCGYHDQLVLWHRPATVSRTMTPAQHAALPEYLAVRELRYRVGTPGFRTRQITLVTTLLDPQRYPAEALAELYRQRWQVETNLRYLKQTLGLAVLHSQTVAGVEKEILVFALVYNLVQSARAGAAAVQGIDRERISFVDALQHLRWPLAATAPPALWVNPLRPDRYEPRVRKRRPPGYPLMTQPRAKLRKALRNKQNAA